MKKGTRKDVLAFMESTETGGMNTNQFIVGLIRFKYKLVNQGNILTHIELGPSFEGITRARRWVIANVGIGKRTKADKEQDYIDEYARTNKYNKDD